MPSETRTDQQAADQKLEAGMKQHLTSPITLGGKSFTEADIGTVIQGRIDARNATDAAAATYHAKVADEAAQIASSKVLVAQARVVLLAMFAGAPEVLAAMGLSAKKKAAITVEEKQAAIDKALATRKARHTMGPKKKLTVTGATAAAEAAAAAAAAAAPATPAAGSVTVGPVVAGHTAT